MARRFTRAFTALSLNLFWPKVGTATITTSIPCGTCQDAASSDRNDTVLTCLERVLGDVIDQEFDGGQGELGPPTHIWGFIQDGSVRELKKKRGTFEERAYSVMDSEVWNDFTPAVLWSLGVGLVSLLAIESVRFKCGKRLKRVSPMTEWAG